MRACCGRRFDRAEAGVPLDARLAGSRRGRAARGAADPGHAAFRLIREFSCRRVDAVAVVAHRCRRVVAGRFRAKPVASILPMVSRAYGCGSGASGHCCPRDFERRVFRAGAGSGPMVASPFVLGAIVIAGGLVSAILAILYAFQEQDGASRSAPRPRRRGNRGGLARRFAVVQGDGLNALAHWHGSSHCRIWRDISLRRASSSAADGVQRVTGTIVLRNAGCSGAAHGCRRGRGVRWHESSRAAAGGLCQRLVRVPDVLPCFHMPDLVGRLVCHWRASDWR